MRALRTCRRADEIKKNTHPVKTTALVGGQAQLAEGRGAVAVLIYSDPHEFGGDEYPNGAYPDGPYLPDSGVQRGSVLYLPLCPGNPRGGEALCGYSEEELLPSIPVMPISAMDARPVF